MAYACGGAVVSCRVVGLGCLDAWMDGWMDEWVDGFSWLSSCSVPVPVLVPEVTLTQASKANIP